MQSSRSKFGRGIDDPSVKVMGGRETYGGSETIKKIKRVTIRLDGPLADLLAETTRKTGQSLSQVVRASLQLGLVPQVSEKQESGSFGIKPERAQTYIFPPELAKLLPGYRAFGMEIWPERRRCFGALLAICEVARANSQNAQDQALCAELLLLGKRLGFFR